MHVHTCVRIVKYTHNPYTHTHRNSYLYGVCVCIYTRIGRYIYVRAVMGWGLAGSDDTIQGVTHMFIFSPLHLP